VGFQVVKRLAILLLLVASSVRGQVIQVTGGASTLFNAEGGAVTFYTPGTTSSVGVGVLGGHLVAGANTEFEWRHWDTSIGDRQLFLTTGLTGTSVAFRGVTATKKTKTQSLTLFTGLAGHAYSTPFFSGTTAKNFGSGVSYRRLLGRGFSVATVGVLAGSRKTALQEVTWKHRALSLSENAGWLENREYTNAMGSLIFRHFGAQVTRSTYIWNSDRLAADSQSVAGNFGAVDSYASAFQSRNNHGQAIGGGYRTGIFQFRTGETFAGKSKTLSGSVYEQVTRHFSIAQYITRSQGQTQVNFGGEYTSNLASVGVSYQEMFAPFGPTAFTKVLTLSLRFQFPHGETVQLETTGKRWTAMGGAYIKTGLEMGQGEHQSHGDIKGALYSGSVVDEEGNPVAGIAVRIGKEITYSNEQGELMARSKRGGRVQVSPAPGDNVAPGIWECVTCPETATPGEDFKIVVRRKA
jgi:hypothetical protein